MKLLECIDFHSDGSGQYWVIDNVGETESIEFGHLPDSLPERFWHNKAFLDAAADETGKAELPDMGRREYCATDDGSFSFVRYNFETIGSLPWPT